MRRVLAAILSGADRGWRSVHWECGLKTCENRRFLRSLPQSQVGIRLNHAWYCSMDCFVKSARSRIAAMAQARAEVRAIDAPHRPRMPIGSVMLAKGYLSEDELRAALLQSQRSGEELETFLIRSGMADEWQLASARAMQWGYPVLSRDRMVQLVQSLDGDLPLRMMSSFSAVPLHYSVSARRLVVGFVYRVEHSLLHALEQATGCRAEPCFITPAAFHERTRRMPTAGCAGQAEPLGGERYREMILEEAMSPAEVARMAARLALEITARESRLNQCRQYLWLRLSGRRRTVDVLFRSRSSPRVQDCDTPEVSHREKLALG